MKRAFATLTSLIIATILLLGIVVALLKEDAYWTIVAIWASALTLLPFISHRIIDRPSIHWIVLLMIIPFLFELTIGYSDQEFLPISSAWYWPISCISIFSLCLVTVADIDSYSKIRLNLNFGMMTTFSLYETAIIIQGPIFYYSHLWLGKDPLEDAEFMHYVIFATFIGLVLSVAFFQMVKRTSLVENIEEKADGESL